MEKVTITLKKYFPSELTPVVFQQSFEAKLGKCKIKQNLDENLILHIVERKFNEIKIALSSFYLDEPQIFSLTFNSEKSFYQEFSNFSFEITITYGDNNGKQIN